MIFDKEFEKSLHNYKNSNIPQSKILFQSITKRKVLDNIKYNIREDGLLIENKRTRSYSQYFPWEVLEGFATKVEMSNRYFNKNPIEKENSIWFRVKRENIIQVRVNPLGVHWGLKDYKLGVCFPIRNLEKEEILNFLKSKLDEIEIIDESIKNNIKITFKSTMYILLFLMIFPIYLIIAKAMFFQSFFLAIFFIILIFSILLNNNELFE